jgi:hypothetical protein
MSDGIFTGRCATIVLRGRAGTHASSTASGAP